MTNNGDLCRRFDISLANREKHDAVTDCFLLSQVYIELIGRKQHKFSFDENNMNLIEEKSNINICNKICNLLDNLKLKINKYNIIIIIYFI